ncbi:MAG TPA: hypothetical protein VLA85_07680 [Verrucomicrobiae bacterium]|nr:hypothetical protein [Verrucomicrobiae bacterium]
MDTTSIFLATLMGLTSLLGIGALIGLLISTWYILLPLFLLAAALALYGADLVPQAVVAAILLAATLGAQYRVWRG